MQMGRLSSSLSSYKPKMMIINNNNNHNRNTGQCKKHPKHKQSPGVCSLCLSEKLTRVSNSGSASSSRARAYYCSSSSLSSSEDSSYASTPASPARHRRVASDVLLNPSNGVMNDRGVAASGFAKSRSMAFVQAEDGRLRSEEKRDSNNHKKVISGFWSKLLRPRRNRKLKDHHGVNVNNVDRTMLMISQSQPLAAS